MTHLIPQLTTDPGQLIVTALAAYFAGSLPFGPIIVWIKEGIDVRQVGSGGSGATNTLRAAGKLAALLTLILDAGKGFLAVYAAGLFFAEDARQVAALFAFLGHIFPIYLCFRGGKGVATFVGALLALAWPVAIVFAVVWLATLAVFRFSSLSSLAASLATPVLILFGTGYPELFTTSAIMTAILWVMHTQNIKRLANGSEPKTFAKSP